MDPHDTPDGAALALRTLRLPDLVRAPDLAALLHVGVGAARRLITRGAVGAYCRLGRQLCVRRDSLMAALAAREVTPPAPPAPRDAPAPLSEYVALLQPRRRRGAAQ